MPKGIYARKPLEERFWAKVDIRGPDECWPWKAGTNHGYGRFMLLRRHVLAHRLAYQLTKGAIPAGMEVIHDCDNRPCCNPRHLGPGTHAQNMQDAGSKGHLGNACGERNFNAKLTADKVLEIRRLRSEGLLEREIAELMGVTQANIGYIVRRKTWKHI